MAAWRIAQVDKLSQRVGRVIQTAIDDGRRAASCRLLAASQASLWWHPLAARLVECWVLSADCCTAFANGQWLRAKCCCSRQHHILEQRILPSSDEPQFKPAEDVVHDALGDLYLRVAGEARRLKARVLELFAQQFQGYAVLQRQ